MKSIEVKAIRLLIFDLDGTLADTIGTIRDGVNMAMEKHGFPKKSYEETRLNIGTGAKNLIRLSMPEGAANDTELFERVYADYETFYEMTCKNCTECYGGMLEALLELKKRGYTIAVLSNKQDKFVKAMVDVLLPRGVASVVMGQTELPRKPDPTVPLMIAEELGFNPEQTAFIGDSDVDIKTGHNSGMLSVGCSWGYRGRTVLEKAGADVIIDEPSELTALFSQF